MCIYIYVCIGLLCFACCSGFAGKHARGYVASKLAASPMRLCKHKVDTAIYINIYIYISISLFRKPLGRGLNCIRLIITYLITYQLL